MSLREIIFAVLEKNKNCVRIEHLQEEIDWRIGSEFDLQLFESENFKDFLNKHFYNYLHLISDNSTNPPSHYVLLKEKPKKTDQMYHSLSPFSPKFQLKQTSYKETLTRAEYHSNKQDGLYSPFEFDKTPII